MESPQQPRVPSLPLAHFTDEETEAEEGNLSKVGETEELGFEPRSLCFSRACHRDVFCVSCVGWESLGTPLTPS